MALTDPLPIAAFADKLGITSVKWKLQDNRELSGIGSGQVLQANLAPEMWLAEIEIDQRYHPVMASIEAMLEAMISRQGSFYLYDPRRTAPITDPNGTVLGASTVRIDSVPNSYSMSLKGLPAGYVVSAGDFLSFDFSSAPTRRAFHRVLETVAANGSGVTPVFEVSPFIRVGAAADIIVSLIKPAMRAIITPGSYQPGSVSRMTSALSFSAMQKL